MIVKRNSEGTWGVYRGLHGKVAIAGPFAMNAEAWRWIDRQQGAPVSKAEQRGEWQFNQHAGGNRR